MGKAVEVFDRLIDRGVSRRDFMKFCSAMAATLGVAPAMAPKIAEAVTSPQRPPVIWLHFAECTGCSEAFLRTTYPSVADVILDAISVEYHETIMAAAGHQAEEILAQSVEKYSGKFILVVEGAVMTADDGVWGKAGGHTFLSTAKKIVPKALATIAVGTCACYGGVQAAAPNPTQAMGVGRATGIKTINVPGCPPNPINLVAVIVHYLLLGSLPAMDTLNRPLFAYGSTIHDKCPRRSYYEMGEFVTEFDDEGARNGYCLYEKGCAGPDTYNNCPSVLFNQGTAWPIGAGHPCIGCSEPDFWDRMAPFFKQK